MKTLINTILGKFGYQIRASHVPLQSFKVGVEHIAKRFDIDTVVDVGVAHNTNDLYAPFTGKQFLLIEANPGFKQHLEDLRVRLGAKIEMVFCGEKTGEVVLNIPDNGRRASAYTEKYSNQTSVKMETLDTLVERNGLSSGSILLKVDVEGAELDVLRGGGKTIRQSEVIILEICWGVPFTSGASSYIDVLQYMEQNGFTLFNIVEGGGISRHDRLTHADFIFVKK